MEEHRLKPMPKNFNEEVFADIYQKTSELRKKLAYQIDHRRYGVEREDIMSWLDVKFLFTFTKYYNHEPEILKAHIINSLQFFKNRILRYSYSQKNSVNLFSIDIDTTHNRKETQFELSYDDSPYYLKLVNEFMRSTLSEDAYKVLQVELNPPHYILKRLSERETTTKIPSKLISEYLGLKESEVSNAKKEIRNQIQSARLHFETLNN